MKVLKTILKTIMYLLFLVVLFVCVNLVVGCVKYWWISDYVNVLNEKKWNETIGELSLNPITWFAIFYQKDISDVQDPWIMDMFQQVDDALNKDNPETQLAPELWELEDNTGTPAFDLEWYENMENDTTADWSADSTLGTNPYDPEFEDEFNSFFAWN